MATRLPQEQRADAVPAAGQQPQGGAEGDGGDQVAEHDPSLLLRVVPPMAFPVANVIRDTARLAQRLYNPVRGTSSVVQNVLIPSEQNDRGVGRRRRRGGGGSDMDDSEDSDTDTSSSDDSDEGDMDMDGAAGLDGDGGSSSERRAYWLQRPIRNAIYGRVWSGVVLRPREGVASEWEITTERCAVKEMEWQRIRQQRGQLAENPIMEVGALQYLMDYQRRHQESEMTHVLVPLDLLNDDRNLYIVSPFCNGGELFDLLEGAEKFPEVEARYWFRQILQGISDLQQLGLCHRDLSLENVLVHDRACIVIDLGMCLKVPIEETTNRRQMMPPQGTCGKWHYMSPEIKANRDPFDGFAVDLWAAGVILFLMLTGFPPWERACDTDDRFKYMSRGYMVQILRDWGLPLSDEVMDLLQRMLNKDPRRRLTLHQIWQHPWIQDGGGEVGVLGGVPHRPWM